MGLQYMSCEHEHVSLGLELRPLTSATVGSAYNRGKTVANTGKIRRSVRTDEQQCLSTWDCVESRSDVDDLRTRHCLVYMAKINQ